MKLAVLAVVALATTAAAEPELAGLAPTDDARKAIAIGTHGEVYRPDGSGTWTRSQPFATANKLTVIGRARGSIVASGEGVVYLLADNGWSAIRLHQKDKAVMAPGGKAVAAVKRQLYSLDKTRAGEPEKLALAPANVTAIGAGTSIVVATQNGLARVTGTTTTPIAGAPKQVLRLVDDRWAITATGAFDLRAGKSIAWPAGATASATTVQGDTLHAVLSVGGKLELATIARGKLTREPIAASPVGVAVGLVVDRADRATLAFADGRIFTRAAAGAAWTAATVRATAASARPGPPPARSQ